MGTGRIYSLLQTIGIRYFRAEQALDNDPERATYALEKIQQLYNVERKAREDNLSWEQRKELRQNEAKPVLEELEVWMKDKLVQVLPKSAIGEAPGYQSDKTD